MWQPESFLARGRCFQSCQVSKALSWTVQLLHFSLALGALEGHSFGKHNVCSPAVAQVSPGFGVPTWPLPSALLQLLFSRHSGAWQHFQEQDLLCRECAVGKGMACWVCISPEEQRGGLGERDRWRNSCSVLVCAWGRGSSVLVPIALLFASSSSCPWAQGLQCPPGQGSGSVPEPCNVSASNSGLGLAWGWPLTAMAQLQCTARLAVLQHLWHCTEPSWAANLPCCQGALCQGPCSSLPPGASSLPFGQCTAGSLWGKDPEVFPGS